MCEINNREYLYLIWNDYKTKNRYIIGELSKNGKYGTVLSIKSSSYVI